MNADRPNHVAPLTLTREQVRELDRRAVADFGVSSLVLMENVGRGAADLLCSLGIAGPVVVACGKGNNAGDGFVVARHLELRGYRVRVLVWSTLAQLSPDAAANARILQHGQTPIEWLGDVGERHAGAALTAAVSDAAWIVDALLGTGASGNPRPPIDRVIRRLNDSGVPIFALDIPSGLDCDTGTPGEPTIRAAVTCTFAAYKPGLLVESARAFVGKLLVADIGVPANWGTGEGSSSKVQGSMQG